MLSTFLAGAINERSLRASLARGALGPTLNTPRRRTATKICAVMLSRCLAAVLIGNLLRGSLVRTAGLPTMNMPCRWVLVYVILSLPLPDLLTVNSWWMSGGAFRPFPRPPSMLSFLQQISLQPPPPESSKKSATATIANSGAAIPVTVPRAIPGTRFYIVPTHVLKVH